MFKECGIFSQTDETVVKYWSSARLRFKKAEAVEDTPTVVILQGGFGLQQDYVLRYISKRVLQENKARQIFRNLHISRHVMTLKLHQRSSLTENDY